LDLRNFTAAVRWFIGEEHDLNVDRRHGGLERDLQLQAVEEVPKLRL
jgi:hypothetical protein